MILTHPTIYKTLLFVSVFWLIVYSDVWLCFINPAIGIAMAANHIGSFPVPNKATGTSRAPDRCRLRARSRWSATTSQARSKRRPSSFRLKPAMDRDGPNSASSRPTYLRFHPLVLWVGPVLYYSTLSPIHSHLCLISPLTGPILLDFVTH